MARIGIAAIALLLATSLGARALAGVPEPVDRELLAAVFPDATRFGEFSGEPPAAPAYRDGRIAGYVFFTREVVASSGFSGKPLNVLVGLDLDGRITGAKIVEHHEPILIIGVPERRILAFVEQYDGRDIREPVRVERRPSDAEDAVDAVAGATISSVVLNDTILRSARAVARSRDILGDAAALIDIDTFREASWQDLVDDGSLVRLAPTVGQVEAALSQKGARLYPEGAGPDDPNTKLIELYTGLATPATIGRNLVGERLYNRAMARLNIGEQIVFVGARGLYSFKGTGYIRSGVFDRIQLVQGDRTIRFRKDDHIRLDELAIEDAPELRERALFLVPEESGFVPTQPWRLELLVAGKRPDGGEAFVTFGRTYELPQIYLRQPGAAMREQAVKPPLWEEVWRSRRVDIAILGVALAGLTLLLIFQESIVRRKRLYSAARTGFLVFTLFWIGWYTVAQLSVLNVLTFSEALRTQFRWDFFLLEPLIFILWSFVAVTLLFWGRGVFCGWLCPFGTLQELLNRLSRVVRIPQLGIPFALNERLWPIKYVAFIGLFALSLGSLSLAVVWAEVEPFKTAIVLRFAREWQYVLYAAAILAVGLFVERPFCRYLCPLGGALAIPARLRMFEWLKRRPQCGTQCHICAVNCPVQAIHRNGQINPNECIYCLKCQELMYDDHVCPPLIERRKRRQRRQAARAGWTSGNGAAEGPFVGDGAP